MILYKHRNFTTGPNFILETKPLEIKPHKSVRVETDAIILNNRLVQNIFLHQIRCSYQNLLFQDNLSGYVISGVVINSHSISNIMDLYSLKTRNRTFFTKFL